jgi:acyl-CoA synthetase (AMP-forming)/AMP-acid ligase II/thioesterase domain-containing protein
MSSEIPLARDRRISFSGEHSGLTGHAAFYPGRLQRTAGDRGAGLSNVERTFFDVIVDHAARDQDRAAIAGLGSDPLSYRKLVAQIGDIWDTLRDAGVGHGSQVAVALPSGLESVISTVAIASHATCVPLNPHLSQSEFEQQLAGLSLDALIVPEWLDSPVRAASENGPYGLFEASKASTLLSNFGLRCVRAAKSPRTGPAEISSRSAVLILRTSATTGASKLVPVTHGNMLDLADKMARWFGLTTEDRAACVLPTYYAAGSKLNVLVSLLLGESIAIPVGVRPERLAEWIGELRPTWFSAGPTFLQAVLDDLRSRREPTPNHDLRFITSGSAHLPGRVRTELEAILHCPILEVYGISEAGVMAANPAPPAKRKVGTVGRIPTGELVIRGESGAILPAGEIGEIFVSGPGLMPGYLGQSEPVGAGLQNGWLATGDIGSVDNDGFLTIVGRIKEVINRGGEKISPIDVEQALMLHPCVGEAAAFGVSHPRLGENVAAAVVLQPEATTTPFELRIFLRDRLAAFKIPQRIDIVTSLPKSHTGKVLRTQLAEARIKRERWIDPPKTPLQIQILAIWQRLLERTDVGIHDDFFEAGGDSLLEIAMLAELELLTGQTISGMILLEAPTIDQLAQKLSEGNYLNQKPKNLVRVNSSGSRTPLLYFHNWYEYSAVVMARFLGSDQPLIIIAPHGVGDEPIPCTIEAMAADRLPLIMNAQPEGPYRLFGVCTGGIVAFEVARMLIAEGKKVEMVIMLDTPTINASRSAQLLFLAMRCVRLVAGSIVEPAMARTWFWCAQIQKFWTISWHRRWAAIKRRVRKRVAAGSNLVGIAPIDADPLGEAPETRYAYAMSNYFPKPLAVRVVHISVDFGAGAWRRISADLEMIKSPGHHYQFDLSDIVEHVRACLASK